MRAVNDFACCCCCATLLRVARPLPKLLLLSFLYQYTQPWSGRASARSRVCPDGWLAHRGGLVVPASASHRGGAAVRRAATSRAGPWDAATRSLEAARLARVSGASQRSPCSRLAGRPGQAPVRAMRQLQTTANRSRSQPTTDEPTPLETRRCCIRGGTSGEVAAITAAAILFARAAFATAPLRARLPPSSPPPSIAILPWRPCCHPPALPPTSPSACRRSGAGSITRPSGTCRHVHVGKDAEEKGGAKRLMNTGAWLM